MKLFSSRYRYPIVVISIGILPSDQCLASPFGSFSGRKYSEATSSQGVSTETYKGRDLLVYAPPNVPARGTRALVIVLHGGLGNASRIEGGASEKGLGDRTFSGWCSHCCHADMVVSLLTSGRSSSIAAAGQIVVIRHAWNVTGR
jgi:hypothetical protein